MRAHDLLVVDDENGILKALRRSLSARLDIHIETTTDPIDGVARLATAPPKVLITDFRMPGMNGVEVLREARTLAPDTIRILLTSHADREHIIEAINDGKIYRFVAKPWDDDSLAALVEEAMGAHDHARAARRNQHIGRDVARIGALQRDMLPGHVPHGVAGETAMLFQPAEHVSGDYVDVIPLTHGRTALILGDVCGHGIGAALFVFTARALLRSALIDGVALGDAVERTNRFLCRDMAEGRFMTLFAAIHDPYAGCLEYVNAGQAYPQIFRAGEWTELERTALPLGLTEDADYRRVAFIEFDSETTMFACSDGLLEARNEDGDCFGSERLRGALESRDDPAPQAMLDRVRASLLEFRGAVDDDLTILAFRPFAPAMPPVTRALSDA